MNINILPSFATQPKALHSAKEIEAVRRKIADRSEALRLNIDPHPHRTATQIARLAGRLTLSDAPAFETSMTLAAAAGNLRTVDPSSYRVIRDLADMAIDAAHPPSRNHVVDTVNAQAREVQRAAIGLVDSEHSYATALTEAQAAADEIAGRSYERDVLVHTEELGRIARAQDKLLKEQAQHDEEHADRLQNASNEELSDDDTDTVPVDMNEFLFDDDEEESYQNKKAA